MPHKYWFKQERLSFPARDRAGTAAEATKTVSLRPGASPLPGWLQPWGPQWVSTTHVTCQAPGRGRRGGGPLLSEGTTQKPHLTLAFTCPCLTSRQGKPHGAQTWGDSGPSRVMCGRGCSTPCHENSLFLELCGHRQTSITYSRPVLTHAHTHRRTHTLTSSHTGSHTLTSSRTLSYTQSLSLPPTLNIIKSLKKLIVIKNLSPYLTKCCRGLF